jgi:two-component system, NtrC family, response regulator GlrR
MSSDHHNATTPVESSTNNTYGVRGFRLDVLEGPRRGASWESNADRCMLGFHPSCSFRIEDETVSRFHCEIVISDEGTRLRDLGSMNGTIVDGVRVVEAFLKNGSLLRLGVSVIRFQYTSRSIPVHLSSRTEFGELIGSSVAMRALFAVLERAAATDATILLEGETGTGKSATARSIHAESTRAGKPFIMIDSGSIPQHLLESELFGHEKGAFTGAATARVGAFEEAEGGTVFIDELGELPLELQPKLLGVLENRSIRRLGSNVQRPVNVRVVAATNRDLRAAVNAGRFREDLYYRVAVVAVTVPALRQRPDDVPLLAGRILARLGAAPERIQSLMTPAFLAALRNNAWPGNVRELRNYLEQYLIFEDMLPSRLEYTDDTPMSIDVETPYAEARQRVLDEFERRYVTELLRAHDGKVAQAAAAVGLNRTYLYRLMQRHHIER